METVNITTKDISKMLFMKYHSHPFPLLTLIYKNTANKMFKICSQPAENAYFDTSKRYTLNDLFGYSRCLLRNKLLKDVNPRTICINIPKSPKSSHSFISFAFILYYYIFKYYR